MARDPAFLFYSQDFYTGVSTMSFEDRGKYITILCLMHQQGRLSEESISFIVGLVSVNLKSKFCIDENGFWYNKRLEEETEKRNKFTESRRNNGLLGGRGKKKTKASVKASAKHMGNHMEDENEDVSLLNKGAEENLHELQKAIKEFLPNVSKIQTQITSEQCEKIIQQFGRNLVWDKLKAMENKKDIQKKYTSVYLTLTNWCKMQVDKDGVSNNASKVRI